jgi:hypothetical protein
VAEGLGVERVAGEDRDVLAVADVARRPPAAQVVVVHRREVVVDERVGVDELDRARQRQDRGRVDADRPGRRHREHRADALAPREQRVAHRLLEARGPRGGAGEAQAVEMALDVGPERVGIPGRGGSRGRQSSVS